MQLLPKHFASTLFASLLLSAAAGAQAESVVLNGFSINNFNDGYSQPGFSVLSSTAGVTTLALDTLRTRSNVLSGGLPADNFEYGMSMSLLAQSGYKIIGYSLSGGLGGKLAVGAVPNDPRYLPGTPGTANNQARLNIQTANATPHHDPLSYVKDNLNGTQTFELSDHFGAGSDALTLALNSFVGSNATYTYYYDQNALDPWDREQKSPSLASLNIFNSVLTIYTAPLSPVPEPGTWMMLSLGLLSLALLKRKQA
ncbi:PEP-CTERM sorting domain-containing protein [Janthinobacterium fluminis]|uniref:PEP-CTERM sorting domain-containing protein n=1 Tax=Janthinobacterium fluminis TaxID=2987524 RepID=A0ABT5JYQ3_9BURK|nr:PEP-CTERM sorting domain-containing protein [Janthinobacterium fluminis]MDC8757611.1 PEP-CTERM sorting domain-containing protein [Janthinobacterium fluminis]